MRKLFILFVCFAASFAGIYAQEFSLKFGKITNYELTMKVYPKDTTASAVVLYDDGNTYFSYSQSTGFKITEEIKRKIKILKQDAVNEATITIPYFYKSNSNKVSISGLDAYSYNIENGKTVKTKLEKKYIFDEEVSKRYRQIKFSIPDVKAGTVIEYRYIRETDNIFNIPDWTIQGNLPVVSSNYEVKIPEYFYYNIDTKGYESIKVEESSEIQQFSTGTNNNNGIENITCSCRYIKYTAKDIPALKDDNYVWCVDDFLSEVRFELKGTKYPNDFYKPYSLTWDDLEHTLNNETDFTSNIKTSDPYREEIKTLVSQTKEDNEKIQLIYSFIKSKIRWNEVYDFMGDNVKAAVKNGTGNNAQINIVLMSALKDAGIKTYPILLSRKSRGRLPLSFPSLNKLNTFIVAAETADGKQVFMDGSAIYGGLNMLPADLLVDRGRVFESNRTEKWVNLSNLGKNQHISSMILALDKDGIMTGVQNTMYINQLAYSFKSSFSSAKDSTKYVDKFQNENQITIDSLKIGGNNPMSNVVKEQLNFTKKFDTQGDFLYINPMIFTHITKNDFTQSERKLPVEFNYPYVIQLSCTITIPDNYKIEEIPKSVKIVMDENKGKCIYQVHQDGNVLQMSYRFELNQIIYPQNEYPFLKDFFGQVATKNAELVVLKKI
jgi:hypothetical protein